MGKPPNNKPYINVIPKQELHLSPHGENYWVDTKDILTSHSRKSTGNIIALIKAILCQFHWFCLVEHIADVINNTCAFPAMLNQKAYKSNNIMHHNAARE